MTEIPVAGAELVLGPMLRHVSPTSATIWVETDRACSVDVLGRATRTFCVRGHHYALVVIDALEPGSTTEYEVHLDGVRQWPVSNSMPPSVIRTHAASIAPRIVYGSCRTAAPHTPPWTLEMKVDLKGRGVDALYASTLRMLQQPPDEWPDLAVFLGDQIYADDSSPKTRARIAALREDAERKGVERDALPPELVRGFEEFCWLYEESWSSAVERWFLSVVPSVMIFDDHEMIDDWNISASWVDDIHRETWWEEHVIEGLMTYWLYQHLGNLSPTVIEDEGILRALTEAQGDASDVLQRWARDSEEFTGGRDRYRFSFVRDLGRVRLVMIDARNSRTLEPSSRRIVDADEWAWIDNACRSDVDHLLIGSSVPVFVPGGLHDLQIWASTMASHGVVRKRIGEWVRRALDLEDWPAFITSFDDLVALIGEVGSSDRPGAPATISILSGDIHFSYVSEIDLRRPMAARVHQLVSSPIRNALRPHERVAMRFSMSRVAVLLGRVLRRSTRRARTRTRWRVDLGPVFENCLGRIDTDGRTATVLVERARPSDHGEEAILSTVLTGDLVAGASANRETTPSPVKET
jgi:hypothetical protein